MKKKVAVFDIDGTIFRSSLLIELVNTLIERKLFSPKVRILFEREYKSWLDRQGSYSDYLSAVVKVFLKNIEGLPEDKVMRAAKAVVETHKNKLYKYTHNLIKELQSRNYYLLAISHSPKFILDEFGKRLGFNKIYGLKYEVVNKKFTGNRIDENLIMNKAGILNRAVEKEHLTLKGSVGVGDTESDIVFLKLVEKPICFNPNSGLYKEAKKNKWKVVVERKDVIYEL